MSLFWITVPADKIIWMCCHMSMLSNCKLSTQTFWSVKNWSRKSSSPQYFILNLSFAYSNKNYVNHFTGLFFLASFYSISIYKSCQGSKKIRLQHFFTPEKSTVMSLTYRSQFLFAGLVNGNISIYTKAEGNIVIWFDGILRNSHVSVFWQK